MKWLSVVLCITLTFFYSCHSPKTNYKDLQDNPVFLKDFKGQKLLLNFWSTTCKPCIEEMHALERAKPFLEKHNYKLLLVSNESIQEIERFKSKTNLNLEYIKYTGSLSELKIYALPSTIVFNENGKKTGKLEGKYEWDVSIMLAKLKEFK